jgi:hypothetical protein
MYKIINKIYNWFLNINSIAKLKDVSDCEILFWASDFTHLREQLPIIRELNKHYKTGIVTNKKILIDYLKKNKVEVNVGYFQFGKTPKYSIENLLISYLPKISYAIIGNDLRVDDSKIAEALIKLKIPYGIISHGLTYLSDKLHTSKANHFYVWTNQEKEIMLSQGIGSERIILSGSPYLDMLNSDKKITDLTFLNDNFDIGDKVKILIANSGPGGTNTHEEFNEIINGLNTIANEQKETHFFLNKLHRKDKKHNYKGKNYLNIIDDNIIPEHISKLVPLLYNVDIVISGASTSVLEAMIFDKPVVIFDKNPSVKKLPFLEDRIVKHCISISELKRVLNDLERKDYKDEYIQKQRSFLQQHFPDMRRYQPAKIIANKIMELNQC